MTAAHTLAAFWLLMQAELPTYEGGVALVRVDVQVLAAGKAVHGLTQNDFRVWDDGRAQPIVSFGAENQSLDVMLLLDSSSSTLPIERRIKSAAVDALSSLGPLDRIAAAFFNTRTFLVSAPTPERPEVSTKLRNIPWGGDGTVLNATVLNGALYLARQARPAARRAIVILTDNEGRKEASDEAVRTALWENDVILSALIFPAVHRKSEADIRPFVEDTGGDCLAAEARAIPFDELFRRLRERYVLFYRAPARRPGMTHTIKVDLSGEAKSRLQGVSVKARHGYVARRGLEK